MILAARCRHVQVSSNPHAPFVYEGHGKEIVAFKGVMAALQKQPDAYWCACALNTGHTLACTPG